ncbi:tail assembly chaperone [Mycobacterium phage Phantastic]|uniref:Tail assembly chaperone n=1 Tax=Mycobacterium phage Phantastic TaxID=1486426 RepID=A0A023W7D8_9CAUD|nr:tail assembly chaperone [Mycobacterium phage Phantastic]AHY27087.1 tail assembly chaperone [Mycobacterium phage Phantastic]
MAGLPLPLPLLARLINIYERSAMSKIFTLDSFREEVEKEFAPVKIEVDAKTSVVLRNLLRVPKAAREEIFGLLERMDKMSEGKSEDEMTVEELEATAGIALRMIELVADTPAGGRKLVESLEDDLALTLKVFEAWMEATNPGGSAALARLIDDYGDAVAADLMETYGVDLRDIFVPESRLTPKWVLVLIKELPVGSRFYSEKRGGPQFRGWDESRYTLAAIVNAVRALQHTYLAAHMKSTPKPPEPYPTPDRNTRKKNNNKPNSFASIAAQMIAAKRAKKARKAAQE